MRQRASHEAVTEQEFHGVLSCAGACDMRVLCEVLHDTVMRFAVGGSTVEVRVMRLW